MDLVVVMLAEVTFFVNDYKSGTSITSRGEVGNKKV